MQRRQCLQLLSGAAAGLASARLQAALPPEIQRSLRVSAGESAGDGRYRFAFELLAEALSAAGAPCTLVPLIGMNQRRIQRSLINRSLDVGVLPSLGFDRRRLAHAAFPLRRGLLGLRLLLVRAGESEPFTQMEDLSRLKKLRMGAGAGWPELVQLRGLGFNIVEGASYAGLFDLLRAGRVDYVTRSVTDIWSEIEQPEFAGTGLAVVPGVAMFYPIDDYFVALHDEGPLLDWIAAGLDSMVRSGRYWGLFNAHFRDALARTDLPTRRIFNVTGFGVEADTPLQLFDVLKLRPMRGEFRLPPL